MNNANHKNIIIPHLKSKCTRMDILCEANKELCIPLAPHPIYIFKELFDEFLSKGCRCKL